MAVVKSVPPQYRVKGRGKRRAITIPLSEYRRLIEDLHDLAVVAERRNEGTFNASTLLMRLGLCGKSRLGPQN